MSSFTPGPWNVVPGAAGSFDVLAAFPDDGEGTLVAATYIANEEQANARLIAAAPDLLAACKRFMDLDGGDTANAAQASELWSQMAAAIAKAEGATSNG
jgi:hypothetical protein